VGLVDFGVGEEGLDKVLWLLAAGLRGMVYGAYLAVIKGTVHSQVVHIGVHDSSHLRFLDGADLAVRVHDEDGHILLSAQTIDGR
jgi:hypothetical protein